MVRRCQKCRTQISEDFYFCGNCGTPTRTGVKFLEKSEKLALTLSQLERSQQAGYISKAKYEEQKAKYNEELSRLQDKIEKNRPNINTDPGKLQPSPSQEPTFSDAKNAVIYADPPQLHIKEAAGYLIATAIIVTVSLWFTWGVIGDGFENIWLDKWYLLAFSFVGPAIYLTWMYRADKFEREPVYLVILIVGWGMFAAFLSLIGNSFFKEIGLGAAWLGAPIVEESMKAIGVYLMAKNPEFNNSMDGIVYGFASGMGFAWAENFLYIILVYEGDLTLALLRVFIFCLGHGIYTAYTGWALGKEKVRKGYVKFGDMRVGLAMAMIAHGIYNSDILQVDSYASLALWVIITLGTFSVILYALIRRSWADEKKWHYDDGYAPKGLKQWMRLINPPIIIRLSVY